MGCLREILLVVVVAFLGCIVGGALLVCGPALFLILFLMILADLWISSKN